MSGHKFLTWAIALTLANFCLGQNLELVENKGQWDPSVQFKAGLINGAFYLGPQGYRVTQFNSDDFQKLHDLMHGSHDNSVTTPTETAVKLSSKNIASTAAVGKSTGDDNTSVVLRSHTYQVTFDQSNSNATIAPEKVQSGYNNYFFGNDSTKWKSHCKIFGGVMYKNMYPGIDVRYYSDNGKLKYDIVVQPNADVSKLALVYDGADGLAIKNNELIIKTSIGDTKEQFPYSYQLVNGVRTQVDCKFKIYGNKVKYQLGQFDHTKTLVIDPTLVFSSFTASTADNWGYTATYGPDGSMFGGGIAFGTGYPVSNGAAQTTFGGGTTAGEGQAGGFDIGIIKLSPNGSTRTYATYMGGNGSDVPHSMVVDAQGNLVVAGRTTSTNFPSKVNIGSVNSSRGATDWDIVIFKLSADGSKLSGAIQIGGNSDDGVNIQNKYPNPQPRSLQQNYGDDSRSEVILNGTSIWLASCSQSANFPVTANAAQSIKADGQDGLLLQFDANLTTCNYATFMGGSKDDAAYVISSSPTSGNIFVGGVTSSTDFPGDHTGTVGPIFTGSSTITSPLAIDGFVSEYSPSGALLKSTFIGTSSGITLLYGLKFDRLGFPYIMGTTTGTFPVSNAAFGSTTGKQFIAKMQKDLSGYVYSTAFGSGAANPNISPIAFLVDRCENVYLSGWGGPVSEIAFPNAGTKGLPVTSDAIQSTTDGMDMYFFVLAKDAASQLYGSFFGQVGGFTDHVDGGTSRFDETGIIYQAICANCSSPAQRPVFPVTPGVWGPKNLGTECNEALVKIAFNFSGVHSGVKASVAAVDGDTTGCVPLTISFRDTIALAQSYSWDFGDGSAGATTLTANISHTYNSLGVFQVRLIATDTTKCFPYDTTYTNVRIRADSSHLFASSLKLPPCTSTTYQFTNTSVPYAGKAFKENSFLWIWGDNSANTVAGQTPPITHMFPGTGTYNVKLVLTDTNFCNAPDTLPLTVRVSPNVKAILSTPAYGCAPYNAVFNNISTGGLAFFWNFGDGNTSTLNNPTNLYSIPGIYTVKMIAYDSTSCNFIDSTTFTLTVSDKPSSAFSYSPNPAQENILNTFTNLSTNGTHYNWLFGDGDNLLTIAHDTIVRHQYQETNTFTPCLVAINDFGCPDTSCQNLTTIIVPLLDVPNAFTPNGDGVNDKAIVVGVGISKMIFRIYNRLGQLVFETTDYKQGWDGIFNGKPQPMDAYGYTLEAQFYDGKSLKKSGDITLLR